MRFLRVGSHRLRIGLAAFFSALVVIGVAFAGMAGYTRRASIQAGIDTLRPLAEDIARDYEGPQSIKELKRGLPKDVAVAIYEGSDLLFQWGDVTIPADAGTDERTFDNEEWITARYDRRRVHFLVGRSWKRENHSQYIFLFTLTAFWIPLAGFVGLAAYAAAAGMFRSLETLTRQAAALSAAVRGVHLDGSDDNEIQALSTELNGMLDRVWSEVGRRDRLVADIAHDLRTPLTIIRGRLETLLLKNQLDAAASRSVRIAVDETERLSGLLELILESGETKIVSPPAIELESLVISTAGRWEDQLPNLGVSTESVSASITVSEITRLMDNLLDNARRFAPEGSRVKLELHGEPETVVLSVSDAGPGIAPENRERVFDRFVRLEDSRNRGTGGFGLGLAVCREIARARGGDITISESDAGGAKFTVRLPRVD